MFNRLFLDVYNQLHNAFRAVIPEPTKRIPITWRNYPNTLAFLIPLIFMAYLVRRPNTYLIRLFLLPTLIAMTLYACFGYMWTRPSFNVYNWAQGLVALTFVGKGLEYAFTPQGRWKIGESKLGQEETPAVALKDKPPPHSNGFANGSVEVDLPRAEKQFDSVLPKWFLDSVEVLLAMRGIGWDFGRGVHIPREPRPLEQAPYLKATLVSALRHFITLDFFESCLKLVPGVGSVSGGTIFLPTLPPLYRYTVSTAIHIATGTAFIAGFGMVYDIITLIAVGLFGHKLSSWPPVFDNPWVSESLHEYWAKRWHQLLRQTFLVYGGYPGLLIGGKFGLVIGTFLASGFYHECAAYAMGRPWEWRPIIFFLLQGCCIILERVWRQVTGRRVGGWAGTAWVYFCIMVLGQICVDSWHSRGLAGGMVIPPLVSPTRQIVFPIALYITGR
ncbi:hypothetical protein BD410DRAFT_747373 [Rickenella mellea]|uniref:Wax synthase domain-containing protein n=1 Tax=Rickenella mellea TaxID=50990 RepID=A0A4Y7Q6L6_9AGAM|nr:hypothetical protein BD410DRAFT_747373 [Rickenella mellea]